MPHLAMSGSLKVPLLEILLKSKVLGCLVGSAIGDSVGSPHEGLGVPQQRTKPAIGRWTDDTHMMIGVAESLIENEGFNGRNMAQTFISNYEQEPWRGYASGPPMVFSWIKSGIAWNEAARKLHHGEGSFGNRAAMRVSPVGLLWHVDPNTLRSVARSQSRITHTHELGIQGAVLQAYAVASATNAQPSSGLTPAVFIESLIDSTPNELYKQKLRNARKLLEKADRQQVARELGNGVEAFNSVPTAVYSFLRHHESFEEAIVYAVRLGGDSDTIAAMTGAISGAYHGIQAIPEEWRTPLERGDYIEELAKRLYSIKYRKKLKRS